MALFKVVGDKGGGGRMRWPQPDPDLEQQRAWLGPCPFAGYSGGQRHMVPDPRNGVGFTSMGLESQSDPFSESSAR